jgi:hypothetical protein
MSVLQTACFLRNRRRRARVASVFTFRNAVLTAAAFALVCLGLAFLSVRKAATGMVVTEQALNTFAATATREVTNNGDEAHRVLLEAGLTATEARKAAVTQRKYWETEVPVLTAKSELTLDRTNELLASLKKTSDGFNGDGTDITKEVLNVLGDLRPALQKSTETLQATADTARAATKVIGDPAIPSALKHVDTATGHIAEASDHFAKATDHVEKTMVDIQGGVHTIVHPTKVQQVKNWITFSLDVAQKFTETHFYWPF